MEIGAPGPKSAAFFPRQLVARLRARAIGSPFARARGIFGRPVSDYLPGTGDLDTPAALAG